MKISRVVAVDKQRNLFHDLSRQMYESNFHNTEMLKKWLSKCCNIDKKIKSVMTLYTSARHPWSFDIEGSLMLTVTQGI